MSRQMRKLLLSTFVGGALAVSALGGAAQASVPGQVQLLQPASGWAVSRIPSEAGATPFCAMARKFSDNVILTFARNAKNEVSIAVDFQRDALNNGQTYFTVLKPGYSQDRAFNIRPVSPKALVIRMGSDRDFIDALVRSQRLNLDLDGSQYSFVMPDLANGLHDVEDCLSSVIEPQKNDVLPAPDSSQVSAQPVDASPASNVVQNEAVTASPLEPIPLSASSAPSATPSQESATLAGLRAENAELKGDIERARQTVQDSASAQSGSPSEAAALAMRVQSLQRQNDLLRQKIAQTAVTRPALDAAAKEQLGDLKVENDALKQKLGQPDPAIAQQMGALRDENASLKQKLGQPDPALSQQLAALRDENAKLKQKPAEPDAATLAQANALRDDNTRMKQELESLRGQMQNLASIPPAAKDSDQVTIARLTTRIDTLQSENTSLADSLKKAQVDSTADATVVTLAQVRAAEAERDAIKADRDRLARQIDDIRTGKEDTLLAAAGPNWDTKQATQRYAESQREITRLSRQMEDDRAACTKEKKEAEYMLFDPRIASKEQVAMMTKAENNLKKAQAELSQREQAIAALSKDYDMKVAALDSLKKESATQKLAAAKANESKTDLTEKPEPVLAAAHFGPDKPNVAKTESKSGNTESKITPAAGVVSAPDISEAPAQAKPDKDTKQVADAAPKPGAAGEKEIPAAQMMERKEQDAMATVPPPTPEALSVPVKAQTDAKADKPVAATTAAPADGHFITASAMQSLLTGAGLTLSKNVQKVDKASSPGTLALSWETGSLFGSAEERTIDKSSPQFESYVQQYIDKTKARCQGQFAAVPGSVQHNGAVDIENYEIACVTDNGTGASAALLFYAHDGIFATIAHEAGVDGMDKAMDVRDHLASSLGSSKVASK